jgi:heat shock protein HslJ
MRSRAIVTTLAALVLVAAGCAASGGTGGTLEGTTWLMKSYDNGSSMVDVPQGIYPDARFASGTVSGVLVCNSYSGGYTQSGSSLTISALAMTQMACANTSPEVESQMAAAMQKAATYTASNASLKLYDASGKNVAVFQAAPADPLAGTSWTATGINNGQQAVVSPASGTTITAQFSADGQMSGNGGCNDYSATFTAVDGSIAIGPVAATQKACDAAVMDQESQYFAALANAHSFEIQGGTTLTIRDASGAMQVTYAKQ